MTARGPLLARDSGNRGRVDRVRKTARGMNVLRFIWHSSARKSVRFVCGPWRRSEVARVGGRNTPGLGGIRREDRARPDRGLSNNDSQRAQPLVFVACHDGLNRADASRGPQVMQCTPPRARVARITGGTCICHAASSMATGPEPSPSCVIIPDSIICA